MPSYFVKTTAKRLSNIGGAITFFTPQTNAIFRCEEKYI